MKKLLLLSAILITLMACSDKQKEDIADTVDDMTGISKVYQSKQMRHDIDSFSKMEQHRIDSINNMEY